MSNVTSFIGTVARDAEVRHLPNGTVILTVSVANNIGYGDKQKTNWFRVSVFGKRAEGRLQEFLVKGQQVFVSGELTLNEYTNKEGVTRASLEVNAQIVDLVGGKKQAQEQPQQPVAEEAFDSDIPF
jgi:single-strand DNA-binding protein